MFSSQLLPDVAMTVQGLVVAILCFDRGSPPVFAAIFCDGIHDYEPYKYIVYTKRP